MSVAEAGRSILRMHGRVTERRSRYESIRTSAFMDNNRYDDVQLWRHVWYAYDFLMRTNIWFVILMELCIIIYER